MVEEDDDDASEQMLDEEEHTVMVKQHDEQLLIGLTEKTGVAFSWLPRTFNKSSARRWASEFNSMRKFIFLLLLLVLTFLY
jgi:hypothetical protein